MRSAKSWGEKLPHTQQDVRAIGPTWALFHWGFWVPFSRVSTKLARACCCLARLCCVGGSAPGLICLSRLRLRDCCWSARACCSGLCASPACVGAFLAPTVARWLGLCVWARFSCRATKSAERLTRSLLVAGLTKLTVRFAPARQNPLLWGPLGTRLAAEAALRRLLLLPGLPLLAARAVAPAGASPC